MKGNNDTSNKILIIDDEEQILKSIGELLQRAGFDCITASNSTSGLALLQRERPLVVITDLKMEEDRSGIHVLEQAKDIDPDAVVILYTAHGDVSVTRDAFKKGAFDFIPKVVQTHHDILTPVERAFRFAKIQRENQLLKSQLDMDEKTSFYGAVGSSQIMLDLFDQVKRVAQTNANVLITGDTGTGKEVIARGIHHYSKRADESFVPVVVSALPESLLEGELFGHIKGAFTSATSDKAGLFEAANKGTIFLDEIGEVPLQTQPKLLRVLQERKVRRLGSVQERDIDVRIISATNQDPIKLIEKDKLREDLYFRLNVVHVHIPPLKARKEDIPVLAYHFLKKYRNVGLVEVEKISPDALFILQEYDWPGNVRQLQNAIESAIAVATREVIRPEDLPEPIRPSQKRVFLDAAEDADFKAAKDRVVKSFERQYLETLLEKHHNNISKVAQEANLNRKSIYRMLESLDIDIRKK
ncbi:sigma-54-dependent Fis family transcriptional regulator [candidate division KSB1 bacterium]|nr:sigma-54-dependent Fis family transcriptional regulator [candidate division KSB1 bacterium]RQW01568.1 MAG: sigma-54-dependent Fis family transcriptional regulator [candidate division KSB1 bacterium]